MEAILEADGGRPGGESRGRKSRKTPAQKKSARRPLPGEEPTDRKGTGDVPAIREQRARNSPDNQVAKATIPISSTAGPFDDEPIELAQVVSQRWERSPSGARSSSFETPEIRNEKTIVMFALTDFTDTIMVKMFVRNDQLPDILAEITIPGAFLKLKGVTTIDKFDGELAIGSVTGIRKIPDFTESRKDTAPQKRVELHCHTKMSDMDGVSEVEDLVRRAHDWGHKAIAITDHGVVQAFPEANHYIEGSGQRRSL